MKAQIGQTALTTNVFTAPRLKGGIKGFDLYNIDNGKRSWHHLEMAIPSVPSPMRRINLDVRSACSVQLFMRFDETPLSSGTAFFLERMGRTFLVTNWHNVTGRNSITLEHLDKKYASEPNRLQWHSFIQRNLNVRALTTLELFDSNGEPNWLEHPIHGHLVDVVCIEIPIIAKKDLFVLNEFAKGPWSTSVADDVFILGYPLGININLFPLWKRATVASEPDFDVDNLPKILVDTATASGMSGSPVLRHAVGGATEGGGYSQGTAPQSTLVGIYSGRVVSGNSLDAQLGIVWKLSAINEIIDGATKGRRR